MKITFQSYWYICQSTNERLEILAFEQQVGSEYYCLSSFFWQSLWIINYDGSDPGRTVKQVQRDSDGNVPGADYTMELDLSNRSLVMEVNNKKSSLIAILVILIIRAKIPLVMGGTRYNVVRCAWNNPFIISSEICDHFIQKCNRKLSNKLLSIYFIFVLSKFDQVSGQNWRIVFQRKSSSKNPVF